MEIDPALYGSSPQPTSHPLFAYREPPASLSSTKSFPYDGAWLTPVPHTASMRKGSKPSWIWATLAARIRPKDGDAFNPIQWWVKKLDDLLTIAQYALDLPCCLVMSAECERVFSGAELLISPSRNRLADNITEAAECLRIWWMRAIIED
jgi:hypothetical protein